ncbi:MAG: methyltransferase family protein [Desulfobaccales bacterium]
MNAVRYYLALIMVVTLAPAPFLWLLIHPFVRFWRRLGPGWTYGAVGPLWALAMAGLFLMRHALLAVEFGTSYYLTALGLLLLSASSWLGIIWFRRMRFMTILGLPELAPDRYPQPLLTTGVYAIIRHPRYVQIFLGLLGSALVANYLVLYLAAVLWLPGIYLIVRLEEKELRERFGPAYDEYSRRVPRFLPDISRRAGSRDA